LNIFSKE